MDEELEEELEEQHDELQEELHDELHDELEEDEQQLVPDNEKLIESEKYVYAVAIACKLAFNKSKSFFLIKSLSSLSFVGPG